MTSKPSDWRKIIRNIESKYIEVASVLWRYWSMAAISSSRRYVWPWDWITAGIWTSSISRSGREAVWIIGRLTPVAEFPLSNLLTYIESLRWVDFRKYSNHCKQSGSDISDLLADVQVVALTEGWVCVIGDGTCLEVYWLLFGSTLYQFVKDYHVLEGFDLLWKGIFFSIVVNDLV